MKSIENYDHAILLGEPGIGKITTVEQSVFSQALKSVEGLVSFIPIILRCNQIPNIPHKPNGDTILDLLIEQNPFLTPELLKSLLNNGVMLIAVDGLNELPRDNELTYIHYLEAIRDICGIHHKNRIVLTCRENEYLDIFPGFMKFFIQPMTTNPN